MSQSRLIAADPVGQPNPALVVAAVRAGAAGLLDLTRAETAADLLAGVASRVDGGFWVRPGASVISDDAVRAALPPQVQGVVIDVATAGGELAASVTRWTIGSHRFAVAQVTSREEAEAALAAGAHQLLASGSEAGGRVGETEAFVLFQQIADLGVPVWVRGGIGLHTAAAAVAGGAAGVVIDSQLATTRESSLGSEARRAVATMDGSETRVVGGHRFYTRPDLPAAELPEETHPLQVAGFLGPDLRTQLLPIGQDGAFAAELGRRFATVGGVVQAVEQAIDAHIAAAIAVEPLAPGAGVAGPHGTRYPIAQGPMTRVSDRADFALAVADGGGLPFLALALMSGPEVRRLLEETRDLLGDRPWGVGVLGFVPPEIRAEQLEVVHDIPPTVALIAGGRPSQATPLEEVGISTYLHVPSPGLLDRFLKDGARKFVFEGRECGGHVGPRSSFALWDAQISRLLAVDDAENLQILLAGGIHDPRSAAMAAVAAAPLVAKGAHLGVLMGTAYLFTQESVAAGAIQPAFQDIAVTCDRTVLLETSPGHATRCVETGYVTAFVDRKHELQAAGVDVSSQWAELETLNLGRLRIASKGVRRDGDALVDLDEDTQRRDGMYMIGEVATLRSATTTVAQLHAEVTAGATAYLAQTGAASSGVSRVVERTPDPLDIAIVGMDSFFPGAVGADAFWAEIVAGTDAITDVPAERWNVDLYYDADAFTHDAGRKTPSRWGGFIDAIGFDPLRFGIPPTSLAAIEPVQLLSLEVASRALADAGYAEREFDRSRASVIFGAEAGNELAGAYGIRAFLPQLLAELPDELERYYPSLTEDSFPGVLTNVIAGRIANRLDLGGVNYTVDAACASSLAALDAACKELRSGVSDLVVCGGADLHNGLNDYLLFASVHALSPTGRCRTFDSSADGIALGEGIACVVLKRRVDAERDGDRIYAVIDAVAGSSDGRHLGLTAPRKEGQQRAVERAWAQARKPGQGLGLVEAHGTGTVVGDRTELATLTELFAEAGADVGSVVLGSVKSQIGHTKCAAGLAGLIKAAKAVYHGVLPPTRNITDPNDYYDAEASPFRFLDRAQPWTDDVRRAGISAFGFGGTNFHAVISSAPHADAPAHGLDEWPAELFLIRADGPDGAAGATARIAELQQLVERVIETDPGGQRHHLRHLAASVSASGHGPVQVALVADDLNHLAAQLRVAAAGTTDSKSGVFVAGPADPGAESDADSAPMVGYLYPGQGSQRPNMLADVFVAFPWLADLLRAGSRWTDTLFPPAAFTREQRAHQLAAITATDVAQPTLGLASLALTRILGRLGVVPQAAGGHSYGELAALAAAGVIDDATLLDLSAARGEAILQAISGGSGDPGSMAAVELPIDELTARLPEWPGLVVANHNGPRQAVVSGPTPAIEQAVAVLEAEGVRVKQLPVACAFHSPLVGAAAADLAGHLAGIALGRPAFPVWSNATGAPYGDDVAGLLARQVAEPVRFVEQVESMYAAGVRVFVEAGPGRVLTQQVGNILGDRPHAMVACDVSGENGIRRLLLAAAELAALGVAIDPAMLFDGRATAVELRTLPLAAPGWLVDGAFVRTADGRPVANSLQPANEFPAVALGGRGVASSEVDTVVLSYLQNVRQLVAAERDVMLRYLGGTPGAVGAFDHGPDAIATTAVASRADAVSEQPAPAAVTAGGDRPVLRGKELLDAVLAIVSERTGYPLDMLDPDLDLEADLSIDSIKRIEIVGELAEKVGLPGMDESAVDEDLVEELAQLKTLRGIVAWIDALADAEPPSPTSNGSSPETPAGDSPGADAEPHPALPDHADRFLVETVPLGPALTLGDVTGARTVVVGSASGLLDHVVDALVSHGAKVEHRLGPINGRLTDEAAELVAAADVVVDLTTALLDPPTDARTSFTVLQHAVLGTARRIVAVTQHEAPGGAASGVPGLVRALAREFPDLTLRSVEIDADPLTDGARLAAAVADELLDDEAPASLSWVGGERTTRVVVGPVAAEGATPPLPLDHGSVVVVTGGARGITARVAEALAATGTSLVLVGRSALPDDEDPRTAEAATRAELRQALLAMGELRAPAAIEAACSRIEADRAIRDTLAALAATGCTVEYHAVDVRSPEFAALLADVRHRLGGIHGIIHGAGVLDDRFVRDKSAAGFDSVFGTKVDGARAVIAARGPETRFVALFGSVSGVFGNRGQCDYAAANDALDSLARTAAADGGNARVVSVDWGPWGGGGMVSPELEREYARRGVGLIDPDDGVAALLAEISRPEGPAQVVVMRGTPEAFAPTPRSSVAVDG